MEKIEKVCLDSIINKDGIVVRWPKKKDEKLGIATMINNGIRYEHRI